MIQFEKDGVTLSGLDANGKKFSHYFMEGAPYNDMVGVRDAQLQAARENTQAVANYETALTNAQISVDAGHGVTAPPKPTQKVVSDTGDTLYVPFDPPLKDLRPANMGKPEPSTGKLAVEVAPNLTTDQMQQMFAMVKAMFRHDYPEA